MTWTHRYVRVDTLGTYASVLEKDERVTEIDLIGHDVYQAAAAWELRELSRIRQEHPLLRSFLESSVATRRSLGVLEILDVALHGFSPPPGTIEVRAPLRNPAPKIVDLHGGSSRSATDEFTSLVHNLRMEVRAAEPLWDDQAPLRLALWQQASRNGHQPALNATTLIGSSVRVLPPSEDCPLPVLYIGPLSDLTPVDRIATTVAAALGLNTPEIATRGLAMG